MKHNVFDNDVENNEKEIISSITFCSYGSYHVCRLRYTWIKEIR